MKLNYDLKLENVNERRLECCFLPQEWRKLRNVWYGGKDWNGCNVRKDILCMPKDICLYGWAGCLTLLFCWMGEFIIILF